MPLGQLELVCVESVVAFSAQNWPAGHVMHKVACVDEYLPFPQASGAVMPVLGQ